MRFAKKNQSSTRLNPETPSSARLQLHTCIPRDLNLGILKPLTLPANPPLHPETVGPLPRSRALSPISRHEAHKPSALFLSFLSHYCHFHLWYFHSSCRPNPTDRPLAFGNAGPESRDSKRVESLPPATIGSQSVYVNVLFLESLNPKPRINTQTPNYLCMPYAATMKRNRPTSLSNPKSP